MLAARLKLAGSCRNEGDRARLEALQALVTELGLTRQVTVVIGLGSCSRSEVTMVLHLLFESAEVLTRRGQTSEAFYFPTRISCYDHSLLSAQKRLDER